MRVVLIGPPGVGKGTQGRRLAAERGWVLISTGEMLRDAMTRRTPLGIEAARRVDAGELVPDEVMVELVRDRLCGADIQRGFVLDGFPRTAPQADALEGALKECGQQVDAVISIHGSEAELVKRLSARRECPVCRRAYNLITAPPRDGRHCDDHPAVEVVRRADDAPEAVKRRLEVYRRLTEPLVSYYRKQGRLSEVAGTGSPDEVYASLLRALESGAAERS